MYKLLSFDVYGTLINTPPINVKAFRLILEQAGASNIDPLAFYQFWESRNIVHYREPYRRYREIGDLSLEEAFENFGVVSGRGDLIERYFELFPEMQLYPDVLVGRLMEGTNALSTPSGPQHGYRAADFIY